MKYSLTAIVVALGSAATWGCAEDRFVPRTARIEVEIISDGAYNYQETDEDENLVVLGEVPVYAAKKALFRITNPTSSILMVEALEARVEEGRRWKWETRPDPTAEGSGLVPVSGSNPWPRRLNSHESFLLEIEYAPTQVGNDDALDLGIKSNASGSNVVDGYVDLKVRAVGGEPLGEPDIEVAYGTFTGPDSADCSDVNGLTHCVIPPAQGLNFGNIGLGTSGIARVYIRNKATCPEFPNVQPCASCALELAANPDAYNLGIGFKPGTNDAGYFSFASSTATPYQLRQRNITCDEDGCLCNESGEISFLVQFDAPASEETHDTVLIIESNDPHEPVIEIPVSATARNAPVAIAQFRTFDPANPGGNSTDPDDIEPLQRVYLDGCNSYDPRDPADASLLVDYHWEVAGPPDVNPGDYQFQGQGSCDFSFEVPLAGAYVVRLTVTNDVGITSGDTAEARVEFEAIPGSRLHVQLVWDHPTNDQDIHMTFVNQEDSLCSTPYDCYFSNRTPVWFNQDAVGEGANPRLDRDDTNGLGPENINIDHPRPGTYRIYVHYFSGGLAGNAPTLNTIRVWLNGVQRGEYRRTLTAADQVWAVADIVWPAAGNPSVQPLPSDQAGEIGSVATMGVSCFGGGGWQFPH